MFFNHGNRGIIQLFNFYLYPRSCDPSFSIGNCRTCASCVWIAVLGLSYIQRTMMYNLHLSRGIYIESPALLDDIEVILLNKKHTEFSNIISFKDLCNDHFLGDTSRWQPTRSTTRFVSTFIFFVYTYKNFETESIFSQLTWSELAINTVSWTLIIVRVTTLWHDWWHDRIVTTLLEVIRKDIWFSINR